MLYRASNTRAAYKLFREVLANHTKTGSESPWTDSQVQTTKGKLIYSRVNAEANPEGLAAVSRSSMLNGLPSAEYNRQYVERIEAVTVADLERVAQKYDEWKAYRDCRSQKTFSPIPLQVFARLRGPRAGHGLHRVLPASRGGGEEEDTFAHIGYNL